MSSLLKRLRHPVALVSAVMLLGTMGFVGSPTTAHAAEIGSQILKVRASLTGPDKPEKAQISKYRLEYDGCIPDSAAVGDTWTVELPEQINKWPPHLAGYDNGKKIVDVTITGNKAVFKVAGTGSNRCFKSEFGGTLKFNVDEGPGTLEVRQGVGGKVITKKHIDVQPPRHRDPKPWKDWGKRLVFGDRADECRTKPEKCLSVGLLIPAGDFGTVEMHDDAGANWEFNCATLEVRKRVYSGNSFEQTVLKEGSDYKKSCTKRALDVELYTKSSNNTVYQVYLKANALSPGGSGLVTYSNKAHFKHKHDKKGFSKTYSSQSSYAGIIVSGASVDIIKKDDSGRDANTDDPNAAKESDRAVKLPSGKAHLEFTIVNNGTQDLRKLKVSDAVTVGSATVSGLKCDFPDGSKGVEWAGPLKSKHSFKCTAKLEGVAAKHTDMAKVTAVGDADLPVADKDPYNAYKPMCKPKVSVGDFVWEDTNKNGIQDAGEPGIEGVELKLTLDGKSVKDINGKPVGPVKTDKDGMYKFGNLPALDAGKSYTVKVSKPDGYMATKANVGDPAKDSSTGFAKSGDLTMDGAKDMTLDFGFIKKVVPPKPLPSGFVGDFVWEDTNNNGIQDAGEPGIEGVEVKVVGPDGKPVVGTNGKPIEPMKTNARGKYMFFKLPLDKAYTVKVTNPAGYVPTKANVGDSAKDSSTGSAKSVKLINDGDKDLTLDFGFVKKPLTKPKVSVGDLVWYDTNKNGIQNRGEPGIEGVTLTLVGPDGKPVTDVDGKPVGPTKTDKFGKYLFDKLPALDAGKSYTVKVTDPAGYEPTKANVGDPVTDSSTGSAKSRDLTKDGDQDLNLDFGYIKKSPAVAVGDFVWEDTNNNGIQDAGEPGIKDVALMLVGPDDKPVTDVDGKPVAPVKTDANGMYKFEKLPALGAGKSYTVKVTDPAGYQPTKANVGDSAKDSSTGMAKSGDLTKNGDKDMTLDFGFVKPTVSVGDFVWEDTNRNGVQDAGEPGIKGVELKVTIGGDVPVKGVDGKPVKPVMTDANGMYKFEKLPALGAGKSYTVKVTNPAGYVPTKANVGDSAKDSSTGMAKSGDLTKNGDKDMTLDFGFVKPTVSVGDFVWDDKNRNGVQDAGEPGIKDVKLEVYGPPTRGTGPEGVLKGSVKTDAKGAYHFDELPPLNPGESYTVKVVAPPNGYVPTKANVGNSAKDSSTGMAKSGDLTKNGDKDMTLDFGFVKPAVSVGDFVWEDTNKNGVQDAGEPGIEGVELTVVGPDRQLLVDVTGKPVKPVKTDADGKYSFDMLPALDAGQSYTVAVVPPKGYEPTKANAGDPAKDSSTGKAMSGDLTKNGDKDMTLDFGFVKPTVSVGDFVWDDKNRNGVQDAGEPGIKDVKLEVYGPKPEGGTNPMGALMAKTMTDANGMYQFTDLPALQPGQSYTVKVVPPKGWEPTKANVGDSAKDSSTGMAKSGDLTKNGDEDVTLDFGFVKPKATPPGNPPIIGLPETGAGDDMGGFGAAAAIIASLGLGFVVWRRRTK